MDFVTVDDVQCWLKSYGELVAEIENQRERVNTLRSRLEDPRVATITGLPSGGGSRGDRIGAELAYLATLEDKLAEDQRKARELFQKIERAISMISGPGWANRRAVLRMRYLDQCHWEETTKMLFARNADFTARFDSYQRRTFKIHRQALEDLCAINNQEVM